MPPLSDSDPRRLGSYRLAARLGAGGMGVVYLGYARSGAPVAVKVIHPHLLGDAGVRSRFRREIDAAIRVSSRYTARVLDADPAADPPFLVTEFVAGLTLAARVAEAGGLDDAAVTGVAVGVAAGIGAIHAAGVVHRDLSPNNVMLTAEGPRIIDLGIAWVDDATTMTQTGGIIGTPAYMAPEVIRGQAVGPMADVFAWGLLTHYAATGTSPFGTGPTQAMLYRIVHDEPDLTGLADPLRGLVAAALSKAPEQRPSAAQLVRRITGSADAGDDRAVDTAVATLVSHTKRLGVPVTSPVNPRPPRRRSRQVAIGAATAVGLAAVVTGSAWIIQAQAVPARSAASVATPTPSPEPSELSPSASAPTRPRAKDATGESVPADAATEPAEPSAPEPEPEPEVPALNADSAIGLRGIGPIEAGMTIAEAEQVAGVPIVADEFDTFGGYCYYAHAEGLNDHFDFLVESPGPSPVADPRDGIITRVSATQQMASPAQTLSGVGIGDTETDVYSTYPGQITQEPHLYIDGGHYLRFTPRSRADQDYGLVFFTDGQSVLEIHAGDAASSGYVEGCA